MHLQQPPRSYLETPSRHANLHAKSASWTKKQFRLIGLAEQIDEHGMAERGQKRMRVPYLPMEYMPTLQRKFKLPISSPIQSVENGAAIEGRFDCQNIGVRLGHRNNAEASSLAEVDVR